MNVSINTQAALSLLKYLFSITGIAGMSMLEWMMFFMVLIFAGQVVRGLFMVFRGWSGVYNTDRAFDNFYRGQRDEAG